MNTSKQAKELYFSNKNLEIRILKSKIDLLERELQSKHDKLRYFLLESNMQKKRVKQLERDLFGSLN